MIPKKIHYCWFGGKELPRDVKKCIKSWKKHCPDYEIIRWDESNFDFNENEFALEAYKNKAWAFVSDYARLKIIYDNGGIYLDTDVELVKSLDELLNQKSYFAVQQDGDFINTGLGFGSEKGAKIIKEMLDEYNVAFDNNKREELACPYLNTKVISRKYTYENTDKVNCYRDLSIYPSKFFDPVAPGNTRVLLCDETFSIHHYSATWTSGKNRLKRKIINIIGQGVINKIKKRW